MGSRVWLGKRSWILLGRRLSPAEASIEGTPEPDIGLGTKRASRLHAVILRNERGQVFLMDLGSSHGSFLGNKKLPAKRPCEWRAGVVAYFADKTIETFEWWAELQS